MSSRGLLIAASVFLQAQILLANRDDGVAHYYLQKGHKFDQHFDLAVDRLKVDTADGCDCGGVFKAIAGEENKIKKDTWEEMFDKMDEGAEGEKDGKITKDELVKYLKTLELECTTDEVDFIFNKFDADKNGSLDKDEWTEAWKVLDADESGIIEESEWTKAFSAESPSDTANENASPKKDAGTTATEATKAKCDVASIFGVIAADKKNIKEADWKAVFDKADANNDGSITNAEVVMLLKDKGLECKEEGVKFLFDKFDKDGNGLISSDEWKKDAWKTLLKSDGPGHDGGEDGMINEAEWKATFADDGKKGEKGTKSGARYCGGSSLVSAVAMMYLSAKAVEAFL